MSAAFEAAIRDIGWLPIRQLKRHGDASTFSPPQVEEYVEMSSRRKPSRSHEGERQDLLDQLDFAFGGLPLPSELDIVPGSTGQHLECDQLLAKFRGRHWRDLLLDDLRGEADALFFFTPKAFQFFLPAFIRATLLDPKGGDLIPDAILSCLSRPEDSTLPAARVDAMLETARSRGIPESVVREVLPRPALPEDDTCRAERLAVLSRRQKQALRNFVAYLGRYRRDEFASDELEAVSKVLGPEETIEGA